jgi:hypothetical protein
MQMMITRWKPPVAPTRQEQFLLKRLERVRKLLGFLRLHRHELFDEPFQEELASMYRTTGAGKDALPPAMLAMATLVQCYLGMQTEEREQHAAEARARVEAFAPERGVSHEDARAAIEAEERASRKAMLKQAQQARRPRFGVSRR